MNSSSGDVLPLSGFRQKGARRVLRQRLGWWMSGLCIVPGLMCCLRAEERLPASSIVVMPALQRLTTDGHLKQRPVFSPDGSQLLFARHGLDAIQLFVQNMQTGQETRLTDRRDPEYDGVFSPDGKHVAFSFDRTSPNQGDLEVYRVELANSQMTAVAASPGKLTHEEWPAWSPQGDRVAFTSTREGNQELFVVDVGGGDWTRLTSQPGIDAHPAWSPDGETIAFSTDRWGDLEIALINPDGTNLRRLITARGLDDYPAWSGNGKFLAWTTNQLGSLDIAVHTVATGHTCVLKAEQSIETFAGWSPDGRLVFVSDLDGGFDIYLTVQPWMTDADEPVPAAVRPGTNSTGADPCGDHLPVADHCGGG